MGSGKVLFNIPIKCTLLNIDFAGVHDDSDNPHTCNMLYECMASITCDILCVFVVT